MSGTLYFDFYEKTKYKADEINLTIFIQYSFPHWSWFPIELTQLI